MHRIVRFARRSRPRALLAGAGAAVLALTAPALPRAGAAVPRPAPSVLSPAAAGELSARLATRLGTQTAGAYYEAGSGRLVVNVLTDGAADTVRAAGAEAKRVRHSLAELDAVQRFLRDRAAVPGTAWSADPRLNQVVVTADRTVTGARLERLERVADRLGGTVALQRTAGELRPLMVGGDPIWRGRERCSLGFNVTVDGSPHFLTAGHCGGEGTHWSASRGGPRIGSVSDARFPGEDYALVRITSSRVASPSRVGLSRGETQRITRAADPVVGQRVRRSGSTSGPGSGAVTGLGVTVNYREGSVHGLIETDMCAEPGDSGGPLFAGTVALGLTSGGIGDCSGDGMTYYQPVTGALRATGAAIG
ncbi:S1 family peptidase [Streptomyces sp. F63]|uniref:S1 family peptidase n=1 Tax=Streptomyces sp. F63 TaxID=2824887 RepID=UPI001B399B95|nr:S1 family peptidase [Streptomyces sp. F63]MBQ0987452.1 S1 family peptidase [Streptomyces sp. F63]